MEKVPKLSLQDRSDRVVEELKVELALVRRDLVERLRRIEEYITFLESDVSRLRLDLQRVHDKLQEISVERTTGYVTKPSIAPEVIRTPVVTTELQQPKTEGEGAALQMPISQPMQPQIAKSLERKEGLNQTELAIIKYLIDNPGTKSATPIAQTVGKAREHVARTLKKLADEKKIIRDETTWPYMYVVPEDIKKIVQSQMTGSTQTSSSSS
jgi:predicted transcriptional regulator